MCYPSDLSDAEWRHLEPLLPAPKSTGRPRQWDMRHILNGILYLVHSGCAWPLLPSEFPPWSTVHRYFRGFRKDGTWERIHTQLHTQLREQVRMAMGRESTPSGAMLDSQSVKTTEKGALRGRPALATMRTRRSRGVSVTS